MTFDEFVTAACVYANRHREQRFGQACMNALLYVRPDIARRPAADIWEVEDARDPLVHEWFEAVEHMW